MDFYWVRQAARMPAQIMLEGLISVVIPALNEERSLRKTIENVRTEENVEVIVADGGSSDGTVALAQELGAKVVQSSNGRGTCLNAGAAVAKGPLILFLHADTLLPPNYGTHIRLSMANTENIVGAFQFRVDKRICGIAVIEFFTNLRSTLLSLPYGDQALFVRRSDFERMGGYMDCKMMEDYEFVCRASTMGRIDIVNAPVLISARRWEKLGVFRTTLTNQVVVLAFKLGVSPDTIFRWYYGSV